MIKIENVVLPSAEQWAAVIRGMRNPMNSWDLSDSEITFNDNPATLEDAYPQFFMGDADHVLAHKLDEWRDFCEWIKTLPYPELIIHKRKQTLEDVVGE